MEDQTHRILAYGKRTPPPPGKQLDKAGLWWESAEVVKKGGGPKCTSCRGRGCIDCDFKGY